ncbi:WD40 repeat domain-containing protein [Glaciimonas sp. GG7]
MKEATALVVVSQDAIAIPQKDVLATVEHVAWHPNGHEFAVVAGLQVLIFNAHTQQLVRDSAPISNGWGSGSPALAYSPDGRYLAAGKDVISIFDANTGVKLRDIDGPYQGEGRTDPTSARANVQSLVFSPDSQFLCVIYKDYWPATAAGATDMVAAWRVDIGQLLFFVAAPVYQSKGLLTTNIVYSHDGKHVLVGRMNIADTRIPGQKFQYFTYLDTIDSQTGEFRSAIASVHAMQATALAISADGGTLATGTQTLSKETHRRGFTDDWDTIDNQDPVRLWDLASGKLVRELGPINSTVRALAISPDGRYVAVNHSLEVLIFDLASGQLLQTVALPGKRGFSLSLQLAFSPDSKLLAVPLDTKVYLLNMK